MHTDFHDVQIYFGHYSRLVKQRSKRCYFWLSCKWNLKENLGTHLRDNHAYTLLGDFELFWTLVKLGQTKDEKISLFSNFLEINVHDGVSLWTNFFELKFIYRFKSAFRKQEFIPTFTMLRAIFTIFKPNPNKTTWCSLSFD